MKLTVIIPAFNEEKAIKATLKRIDDFLSLEGFDYGIILVDDGSTDRTVEVAESLGLTKLRIISHSKNLGKGAAVKSGASGSDADLILFMDADNSTDICEVEKFIAKAKQGFDIVIGSRALADSVILLSQPVWKVFLGKLGNLIIRLVTGLDFKDTQCGFKLFNRRSSRILSELQNQSWAFDVETLIRAEKEGFKVFELPVTWKNDFDSKFKLRCYFQFFRQLLKMRNNLK